MIFVHETGPFSTIQDAGRFGYRRFGVPVSGAMDWISLNAANLLVGNQRGAACLEIGISGCILEMEDDHLLSVVGDGYELHLDHTAIPLAMSFFARQGQIVKISSRRSGGWAYLGVHGGFQTIPTLHSQSTFVRGKIGGLQGEQVRSGDRLPTRENDHHYITLAGRSIDSAIFSRFSANPEIRTVPGPQATRFTLESLDHFFCHDYLVTHQSDRMGYRLAGKKLELQDPRELLSEGMTPGTIQVPPDGQPIVLMSDSPTSGGYAKIAVVITADLPLVAQTQPGLSRISFKSIGIEVAQGILRKLTSDLLNSVIQDSDAGGLVW